MLNSLESQILDGSTEINGRVEFSGITEICGSAEFPGKPEVIGKN